MLFYNFVAGSFNTKNLCSRLSSSEVQFYTENGRFAVLSPLCGGGGRGRGLGDNVRHHLRLTGERVVDFLLVLIKHFSLGVTAEALRAKID